MPLDALGLYKLRCERQNNGAAVVVPRLPYYLDRTQTTRERAQTTALLCVEWAYVRQVLRAEWHELRPDLN